MRSKWYELNSFFTVLFYKDFLIIIRTHTVLNKYMLCIILVCPVYFTKQIFELKPIYYYKSHILVFFRLIAKPENRLIFVLHTYIK